MGALSDYLTQTRRLLYDASGQQFYNDTDLTAYVNEARGDVASQGQCVRYLTPYSNGLSSLNLGAGGAGYTTATVVIPAPDQTGVQATGTATLGAGAVTALTLTNPGSGYSFIPKITIAGDGAGATATASLLWTNQAILNQEVYPFTAIQFVGTLGANMKSVLGVKGASIVWTTWRYTMRRWSFSKYQALLRRYTTNFPSNPTESAQYSQGDNGSLMIYPVPDQNYPMEWDCICLPIDLVDNNSAEVIPYPWTIAVKYHAAYLALSGSQRNQDADRFEGIYMKKLAQARGTSMPGAVSNWYGRG